MRFLLKILCFVFSDNEALTEYARKASVCTKSAFRPRTVKCYDLLFRLFVAFCLFTKVELSNISVSNALSYLKLLVENSVYVHMINNHISAIRAMSIVYDLQYGSWVHPKDRYFIKSLKLHRPMVLPKRNIIDIHTLKRMVALYQQFPDAGVFKAVLLAAFFGFFRLSNIAPHAVAEFDCTRQFTGGDVFFSKRMKFSFWLNGLRPYSRETNTNWWHSQSWELPQYDHIDLLKIS